jgi:hypothetical protein
MKVRNETKGRAIDPAFLFFAVQRPAISPTPRQSELYALKKYSPVISSAIQPLD